MAKLTNQIKATTENVEASVQTDGNKVELTINIASQLKLLVLKDIYELNGLTEELEDITRTLINELNASKSFARSEV